MGRTVSAGGSIARVLCPVLLGLSALGACGKKQPRGSDLAPEAAAGEPGSGGATTGGSSGMTGGSSPVTGGSGSVILDGGVPVSICDVGPPEDLPACADDVAPNGSCDGTIPGCVATSAEGETSYYLCFGDGSKFLWTPLGVTTTPCDEREVIECTADDLRAEQRILDNHLGGRCLGNPSFLAVQLADGCATLYASSASSTYETTCIEALVEALRFSCITRVPCWTAGASTTF